jgi:hypothetical protein
VTRWRSRLAVIIVAALAVAWVVWLTFGLAWVYGQKVNAMVGQTRKVVDHQLGPPTADWNAADVQCAPDFPCEAKSRGGRVYLYVDRSRGYYLYFDAQDQLAAVAKAQRVRPSPSP